MTFIILLLGLALGLLYGFGFWAGATIGLAVGYAVSTIVFAVRAKRALDAFNQSFADAFAEGDEALDRLVADLKAEEVSMLAAKARASEADEDAR